MKRIGVALVVAGLMLVGCNRGQNSSDGIHAFQRGEFKKAIPLLEKQFETSPTERTGIMLSISLRKVKQDSAALDILNQAVKMFGETESLLEQRCGAYAAFTTRAYVARDTATLQHYSRLGLVDMTKAIRLDSTKANHFSTRSLFYSNLGDFQNAIDDLNRAIELDSTNKNFYDFRSLAYFRAGDFDKALEDAEVVVQMDPNWVKGQEWLEKMKKETADQMSEP